MAERKWARRIGTECALLKEVLNQVQSDHSGASRGTSSTPGELRRLYREALRSRVLEVELGAAGRSGWTSQAQVTTGISRPGASRFEGTRTEASKLCR